MDKANEFEFIYETFVGNIHDTAKEILEKLHHRFKAISISTANLNSGRSYLITAVPKLISRRNQK